MDEFNHDGNALGRAGALALIALAAFGVHRLNCGGAMCPPVKTDSCCAPQAAAPVPPPQTR